MQAFIGVLFHCIGGVAAGSFYMPYHRVRGWAWESYWIVGGLMSWLILPPLVAWLTIPGYLDIIVSAPRSVVLFTFIMGLLWGIGGLSYGLGVRYLGMSLGNSIVLGFCSAFGALIPPIYYSFAPVDGKISLTDMTSSTGGQYVLIGVVVCLIGIAIMGRAGMLKEGELTIEDQKDRVQEFNLSKGLTVGILSGVLSAFFSFGIEAGKPLADAAVELGADALYQNNITFVVILWGGFLTNLIWTSVLSMKNRSYTDFTDGRQPRLNNIAFAFLAGTIWYLQFFFYGMGESELGSGASSWILHMSTIILTANVWGIYRREWYGVSRGTQLTFVFGIATIILSVFLVGIGNSL